MAVTVRVKVLRPMMGDKRYERGDYRTMAPADAERLAATGAVEIIKTMPRDPKPAAKKVRGAKKATAPRNKKAAAPQNKSA